MKKNDWKDRLNIVYSTNPDFNYQLDEEEEPATVDPKQQKLRVSIEKKKDEAERPLPSFPDLSVGR